MSFAIDTRNNMHFFKRLLDRNLFSSRRKNGIEKDVAITSSKNTSGIIDVQKAYKLYRKQKTNVSNLQIHIALQHSFHIPKITLPSFSFRPVGNLLILTSFVLIILFSAPLAALELRSAVFKLTKPFIPNAGNEEAQKPTVQSKFNFPTPSPTAPPIDQQFHITIPAIGIDSNIIANVDINNQKEYESSLKKGIAHAKGTALPGEDGGRTKTIFLFAHSTNATWNISTYNALFYSLKDMNIGDQIDVIFWGEKHTYTVTEKRVVEPNNVAFLDPQMEKEQLILQTCWPPGTSSKRLLIFADKQ